MTPMINLLPAGPTSLQTGSSPWYTITITITKWPHQSEAPVGAAPPTRSQLRLQRQTQTHAKLKMAVVFLRWGVYVTFAIRWQIIGR
jgi:hypothetical protein